MIAGDYIGTDKTGTIALGNGTGINLGGDSGTRVGVDGHDPYLADERNIISGNRNGIDLYEGSNDVIAGNYIGTDVTGTISIGNVDGILASEPNHNELIGTNSDGVGDQYERNIISGNTRNGIEFGDIGIAGTAQDDIVAGNYIGTDVTGTQRLGNGWYGIAFFGGGTGNLIGVDSHAADPADGRNIIAANDGGIILTTLGTDPLSQTVVAGNYIGTDVTGELALGNGELGGITVENATSTRIGTDGDGVADDAERNVIANNARYGVGILSGAIGTVYGVGILRGTTDTLVAGNFIGTDAGGSAALGNVGPGILIWDAVSTQVGGAGDLGNTIAYSSDFQQPYGSIVPGDGVAVVDDGSVGDTIRGNSIFSNDGLGINFGYPYANGYNEFGVIPNNSFAGQPGPNNFQNYPVLTTAIAGSSTAIIGTFNSTPNTTFTLDFYANAAADPSGYGQGQTWLGSESVTTDASGNANFQATDLSATSPGQWISATATDPGGNTSEFSEDVQAVKAGTVTSITTSANPSVYGEPVTFTATVTGDPPISGFPTGTVTLMDGMTTLGTGTLNALGVATYTTTSFQLSVGSGQSITAVYSGDTNFTASTSTASSQTIKQDGTTTFASASPGLANVGQTVTFTATLTANAPGLGTPTGTVDFYDTTTSTDLTPVGIALSSGTAAFATTSLAVGGHTIKVSYSGDTNFLTSSASTGSITIGQAIIVLDPSAGGALSLSGNASIKLTGGVYVDSSSSTALSASGNAAIKVSAIDVHGGVQKSGNASLSPTPVTGAATVSDPLASLAEPSTFGLTNYGSESLSGNSSATIKPGIYSQITVSGNASLTLGSGIYIIEAGGLSVSGNANISGSGVTIVNAGSKYPATGGTYGSITLSGNGSYNLSPPTTGTYAGIVIFQTRDNSKALTLSGNAAGMTGTVYASAAQLAESGNATLNAALIVDTLTISGNGINNTVTLSAPAGTVAYTPAQIRSAYGINTLSFDGTGQTIAIVDAYDDPSIFQALDAFDSQFGLTASVQTLYNQYGPASSFLTVRNQNGQATFLPSTDPNGPGTDNWEVEEALDVEWAHAIAPGAQIILVEANSQSLSDLMASVATAASQPGVSVLSMSWGFAEGQSVFASDEATYDSTFNVPGVTFVASTGDYGGADPEYPAFSPNVVAVGGTSLTLNADNSYNSETGWGYYSSSMGAFIGSGGGISIYEAEPAYQQGVQSTGGRTTPDVSLVADPATGAWIADPYNLDPSNPFEIVGGTSLSAPAWAGLVALVNQGRAAAGESSLNSVGPTDTQQSLYMLPKSDYNSIASGNNGYSRGAGYNLVTGLGTPVANLLVPDLIAYHGPGTSYSGPTVTPLQNAGLVNTGTKDSGPIDVFSVFDALTFSANGFGDALGQVSSTDQSNASLVAGAAGRMSASPPSSSALTLGPVSNIGPVVTVPLPTAGSTVTSVAAEFMSSQPSWSIAQPMVNGLATFDHFVEFQRSDHDHVHVPLSTRFQAGPVADSVLDERAAESVLVRSRQAADAFGVPVLPWEGVITDMPMTVDPVPRGTGFQPVSEVPTSEILAPQYASSRFTTRLAVILLAAGPCGYASGIFNPRNGRAGRVRQKQKP